EDAADAPTFTLFEDGAVSDEGEVGEEQTAAGQHQRQPVADLEVEVNADRDIGDAENEHAKGGEQRPQIPGEDSGDEPQTQNDVDLAGQRGALDESAQNEGVGDVPIATG